MLEWFRRKCGIVTEETEGPLPDERIYAVGDIHGRHDLLMRMVDRVHADLDDLDEDRAARLVFIGDYIDRGDQSREVIEDLRQLCEATGDSRIQVTCLMGNHEAALLNFIDDPVAGRGWLQFGGLQTLASYRVPIAGQGAGRGKALVAMARDLRTAMGSHVSFLRSLPLVYRSGAVAFAHAGLDPDDPEAEEEGPLLWGLSSFIDKGGVDNMRVVHGHYDADRPIVTAARICVDTGAYYTGRLTAVRLDDDVELIEVDARG